MSFESILNQIKEDVDRDQMTMMAGKYPSLRQYIDIGSKVVELSPRLKALGGNNGDRYVQDIEQPIAYAERWKQWENDYWDPSVNMTKSEKTKAELLALAEQKINELEARGETDMTAEEITAITQKVVEQVLKSSGVLTMADLDKKINDEVSPRFEKRLNNTMNNFETVFAELAPVVTRHEKEYGQPIDAMKVFEHMRTKMTEGRPVSTLDAYNAVYNKEITEKSAAQRAKELADAKAEGVAEERKRLAQDAGNGQRAMPISADGGRKLGPMQRRQLEKQKQQDPTYEPPLGRGAIAAKAAQAHREKEFAANAV